MISEFGKALEIFGLLISSSGLIGDDRLEKLESSLRQRLSYFLSRRGYQDTIQRGVAFVKGKISRVTSSILFIWSIWGYLSEFAGILTSLILFLSLFIPSLRQFIFGLIMNNLGKLTTTLVWLAVFLLGYFLVSLLLLTFVSWATYEPVLQISIKEARYLQTRSGKFKSTSNLLLNNVDKVLNVFRKVEQIPSKKWLRYSLRIILRLFVLFLAVLSVPLWIFAIVWFTISDVLFIYIGTVTVNALFVFILSVFHIIAIISLSIAYFVAYVLLLPYYLLDRATTRLRLRSTFIALGIILSVIGIVLQ